MITIIGGGLASAKLVEGYREAGGDEEIVLISADTHPPYHRPPLSKRLLRGEAEPDDALVHPQEWYGEQGVDLRLETRIDSLDALDGTIVLATGARPRRLDGALVLRTLNDSLELRRRAREADRATVVGGGFVGLEVTASLRQLGVEVTLVVREDALFAQLQAPPFSDYLLELYRDRGVDVRLGTTEVPGAELIVAGIGVEPNVELARDAGLDVSNGIVVDERFRTSREGVYAVGDVAAFYDTVFGRRRRIEHWSNANYHGTQLGKILAGDDAPYDIVSAFFSELFGNVVKLFGDPAGHDAFQLEGDFREGRAVGRYLAGDRLVATLVMGLDEETENALKADIRAAAQSSV